MKKPKVFFCWTTNSGTSFYRMFNYFKSMKKQIDPGHSHWKPDFQGLAEWEYKMDQKEVQNDISFLLENCDMTIAQKFNWYGGLAVLNAQSQLFPDKPFYSEFDDHVFAVNPDLPAVDTYYPGSESENIIKEQVVRSTGIIVSTEYLRQVFEKLNPNVWVMPNAIDFSIWDKLKKPKKRTNKRVRIGWAGGGTHDKDLEFILPVIKKLLNDHKNIEFHFLGGITPAFQGLDRVYSQRKWFSIDKYPQAIKDMDLDIGIAPLRDNPFNRGKSNLRWLEYSALKVPCVASHVEPFKCIEQDKTGLLAVEPEEWENALVRLINDADLRKHIGEEAYNKVKKDFNAEKWGVKYAEMIKEMIKGAVKFSSKAKMVDVISGNG